MVIELLACRFRSDAADPSLGRLEFARPAPAFWEHGGRQPFLEHEDGSKIGAMVIAVSKDVNGRGVWHGQRFGCILLLCVVCPLRDAFGPETETNETIFGSSKARLHGGDIGRLDTYAFSVVA